MKIIRTNEKTSEEVIDQAVEVLSAGGLVIFPTETTYGAGVDATNQQAVDKLLAYKTRREGKPLSIAVPDRQLAEEYVEINDSASRMYETFLPGPFTIISKSKHKTAQGVESEFGTLGVRIPDYELILNLLRKFSRPMTATSANASGKKRPYKIDDLMSNLSDKQKSLIDLVIDAGELPHNKPSTIIDTTMSAPMTLRKGDKSVVESLSADEAVVTLNSANEQETMDIASRILLKNWNDVKKRGLIIGLDGELGAGKTIFTKGVAKFLRVDEVISSPTYSYVEEYDFSRHGFSGKLFHLDAWKVDSEMELRNLDFFEMVQAGHVIVVEWWDRVAEFVEGKTEAKVVQVVIDEVESDQAGSRQLSVSEK